MEWNGKNMDYTNKEVEHVHGIKVGSNRQKQIAAIKGNKEKTWAETHGQKEGAKMHKATITGRYF